MERRLHQQAIEMVTGWRQGLEAAPETRFVAGRSVVLQSLKATVEDLARTDMPVLLLGESGTGKEVYARLIHRLSPNGAQPLTKLGCTIIEPAELLAVVRRLEQNEEREEALLLDNVDELNLDAQRALLSALQENETNPGGHKSPRLISTATRNLDREVNAGQFRRELYYRIAAVKIRLPALRERKEDIPEFLEYFLERCARQMGRKVVTVLAEEMEILQGYDWPGNIRELENLAKKIAALGTIGQTITEMKTGSQGTDRPPMTFGRTSLKAVAREASRMAERDMILNALERTHWNRKEAAKQLQISYKALLYKIKLMRVPGN